MGTLHHLIRGVDCEFWSERETDEIEYQEMIFYEILLRFWLDDLIRLKVEKLKGFRRFREGFDPANETEYLDGLDDKGKELFLAMKAAFGLGTDRNTAFGNFTTHHSPSPKPYELLSISYAKDKTQASSTIEGHGGEITNPSTTKHYKCVVVTTTNKPSPSEQIFVADRTNPAAHPSLPKTPTNPSPPKQLSPPQQQTNFLPVRGPRSRSTRSHSSMLWTIEEQNSDHDEYYDDSSEGDGTEDDDGSEFYDSPDHDNSSKHDDASKYYGSSDDENGPENADNNDTDDGDERVPTAQGTVIDKDGVVFDLMN